MTGTRLSLSRAGVRASGFAVALGLLVPGAAAQETAIPDRPEELVFPDFAFETPDGSEVHHTLPNGVSVIVVEDHTLPLIRISTTLRIGGFLDPEDRIGLSSLTAVMMREGGAGERGPEGFDERVEFLAARISASSRDTEASASLRTITPVFDESLDLFFDLLRSPRFDESRFEVRRENLLEDLKQRNDDADRMLAREWNLLLYGDGHYRGRQMTTAHLDAITTDDLRAFHLDYWRPEHMVFAVSGDVDTAEILATLEAKLAEWPEADDAPPVAWPPEGEPASPAPGIYHLEKDIPQGKVRIGHLSPPWDDWDNPDRAAIQVMDHILGASGFTSRIMQRIRSDEGLAYGAGGRFRFDAVGPSGYSMGYQSKSPTVALAAAIAFEELNRIRDEPVTEAELDVARRALVDSFPRRFESAGARASIFAADAVLGRDHAYWSRWRDQVEAVTAADVQAAARKYLRPNEMVMLVVGVWSDIEPGDPEGRAAMADLLGGKVTHLPVRDPLTLAPITDAGPGQ